MRPRILLLVFSIGYVSFACGADGSAESPRLGADKSGKGGSSGSGNTASGGSTSSGGSTNTGGNSGGSDGVGGSSQAGSADGDGAGSGGSVSSGGSAGNDAGKRPIEKSAGCGKANPASGNLTITTQGSEGKYIVSLPAAYDPNRAYPLGFAFHGYGRTHVECRDEDCLGFQEVMHDQAVLVYMKSFTAGWEDAGSTRDKNARYFADVLAHMKSAYCIDQNRVYVAGTSSGAAFANIIACRYGDQLLATAPVAGSMEEKNCVGKVAALVIHGIADQGNNISGGRDARDFYISKNGCSNSSIPPVADVDARVLADRKAKREGHECADYQGCDAGFPVRWCVHSEGGYDDLNHGWPTFGGQEIWDFVKAL